MRISLFQIYPNHYWKIVCDSFIENNPLCMLKFSIHEKKEGVIKLMNFKSFFLGAILFFPLAAQVSADTKRQEAFLQELEAAKYTLTFKYGPTEWKSEYLQWDADAAFEEAKAQMIESPQL